MSTAEFQRSLACIGLGVGGDFEVVAFGVAVDDLHVLRVGDVVFERLQLDVSF